MKVFICVALVFEQNLIMLSWGPHVINLPFFVIYFGLIGSLKPCKEYISAGCGEKDEGRRRNRGTT